MVYMNEKFTANIIQVVVTQQIITDHFIDPVEEVESVTKLVFFNLLEPKVIMKRKKEEIEEAKKGNSYLVL